MNDTTTSDTEAAAFEALRRVIIDHDSIPTTRFLEIMRDALTSDYSEDRAPC